MWTLPSSFIWSFSRDSLHHQSWWRSTAVFAPWSIRIVLLFCICIYVLVDDGQLHYLLLFYLQECKSKNCKSHHVQLELQKPAASRPYISSSSNFEFEEYFPQFFANQSPIKVYLCLNPLTWWVTTSDLIDVTLAYLFPECYLAIFGRPGPQGGVRDGWVRGTKSCIFWKPHLDSNCEIWGCMNQNTLFSRCLAKTRPQTMRFVWSKEPHA